MINFKDLLSRADDEVLEALLGREFIAGIRVLEPKAYNPSRLKAVVTHLKTPFEILSNKKHRNILFELLRENEAVALCKALDLPTEKPFQKLSTTKFQYGSERFSALLEFFHVSAPSAVNETVVHHDNCSLPLYTLFGHQRTAIREVNSFLESSYNRCMLHMPTGSGKTRTAINVICNHLRNKEPGLVLWLANTEELCQQAEEEFRKAWRYVGDRQVSVFKFWGSNELDLSESIVDGIIIAGFQKTYSAIKNSLNIISKFNKNLDMIVIDEAHVAIAETYKLVIESMSLGKQYPPSILGLTATPGRTWNDPDIDRKLADFFYRQKVSLKIQNYANPVDFLVEQGFLARASFKKIEMLDTLTTADVSRLQGKFEIPDPILKKLAASELRNIKIIDELERLTSQHKRIMFFATTVEHSNVIASLMTYRGIWAKSVTSSTEPSLRQKYIREYKDNSAECKILCNYGVLTTGFDAPKTSCALIARPTNSLVLYSQMVGRAIRGIKAGGNLEAEVVTVVDNKLPGFGSVADSFVNWEDIWD